MRIIPHLSHLEVVHPDGEISRAPWLETQRYDDKLRFSETIRAVFPQLPPRISIRSGRWSMLVYRLRKRALRRQLETGTLDRFWTVTQYPRWLKTVGLALFGLISTMIVAGVLTPAVLFPIMIWNGELPLDPSRLWSSEQQYLPVSIRVTLWVMGTLAVGGAAAVWLASVAAWLYVPWGLRNAVRTSRLRRPKTVGFRTTSDGVYDHRADGQIVLYSWERLEPARSIDDFRFRGDDGETVRAIPFAANGCQEQRLLQNIVVEKIIPSKRSERRPRPVSRLMCVLLAAAFAGFLVVLHDILQMAGSPRATPLVLVVAGCTVLLAALEWSKSTDKTKIILRRLRRWRQRRQ